MAGEDKSYIEWLRRQRCCRCRRAPPCEAHHITVGRGMAQRTADRDAIPLCSECHRAFHDASGSFRNMDKYERREWQLTILAWVRGGYQPDGDGPY